GKAGCRMPANAADLWHAWGRLDPRDPWRQLVGGRTEAEALNRALDLGLGGDLTILPAGRVPADEGRGGAGRVGGGGGMPTTFRKKNITLQESAVQILEAERPMTLRQLYYRLVSAGVLANKQQEYKRLGNVMTRLREAGDVPRSWLVDHVRSTLKPSSWTGL